MTGRELASFLDQQVSRWRAASGNRDARAVLVCHSMGGLAARWCTEREHGHELVSRTITIGTPHKGAAMALDALVNGVQLPKRLGPHFDGLVRSLPSVLELLPTYACVRTGAGPLKHLDETDVLEGRWVTAGLGFHRELAAAVGSADRSRTDTLHSFRGGLQPTMTTASLSANRVLTVHESSDGTEEGRDDRGDGTVPRDSATPPEWASPAWAKAVAQRHSSMHAAASVRTELAVMLSDAPRLMSAGQQIGVRVPTALPGGQPAQIVIDGPPGLGLTAILASADRHSAPIRKLAKRAGNGYKVQMGGLPQASTTCGSSEARLRQRLSTRFGTPSWSTTRADRTNMTGRMNLIVVGTGDYDDWPQLRFVQPHHDRFIGYVSQQWPNPRITADAATEPLTAPELRARLARWLTACDEEDDLILLWSGHGQIGSGGMHRLITPESPYPGGRDLGDENSVTTAGLADSLSRCPARRIVVLLNTCWSGDGGQQLTDRIGNTAADSLSEAQDRSMVIISAARREEATDGAFLSHALHILHAPVPPAGLAAEHRWSAADNQLTPQELCAGVNVLLRGDDHQAQLHTPYGVIGGFFRRTPHAAAAPELPTRVVTRLLRDFPSHLPAQPAAWDLVRVSHAHDRLGDGEPTGELRFRLRKLAQALSALAFLEGWLGADSGLANHMSPAWTSVLPTIHRTTRPADRFGYVEQVVLHGGPDEVIEFVARVIHQAGDDPCDDRLYHWAKRELAVDRQVVDDALARLGTWTAPSRLIITFGMTVPDDGEADALPKSAIAWIWNPDGPPVNSIECPFEPPYRVADTVANLVAWAREEVGSINHVDVILPVSLFRSARPEEARLTIYGRFTRPVVMSSGLVVRWAERITDAELQSKGASQARAISVDLDSLRWIDRGAGARAEALFNDLDGCTQAVGFMFEPDDLGLFYAAAYNAPYVLWVDDDSQDTGQVQQEVNLRWPDLPSHLNDAYKSDKPSIMRSLRLIWDDPDWLENVVPTLPNPRKRLRI